MVFGLCGAAEVEEGLIYVRLPARTAEYESEPVVYQQQYEFLPDALSPLERRGRDLETIAAEYETLVEAHGEQGLGLVDGAARSKQFVVHGVLNHRGKALGSVEPLAPAAERQVLAWLSD
jgi:hypothetical protein